MLGIGEAGCLRKRSAQSKFVASAAFSTEEVSFLRGPTVSAVGLFHGKSCEAANSSDRVWCRLKVLHFLHAIRSQLSTKKIQQSSKMVPECAKVAHQNAFLNFETDKNLLC